MITIATLAYLNKNRDQLRDAYDEKQGRRKESRARGANRSNRAPTTIGQQIYPRNGGHPRHFGEYHGLCFS